MRPVLPGDLSSVARALLCAPPRKRLELCRILIQHADAADRYARHLGHAHAFYGNGSLMAAARMYPLAREPKATDDTYLDCLNMVKEQLSCWRDERAPTLRHQKCKM